MKVTKVVVTARGSGWFPERGECVVSLHGGGGTDARLMARLRDGMVESVEVVDGGTGYVEAPDVRFGGPGTGAEAYAEIGEPRRAPAAPPIPAPPVKPGPDILGAVKGRNLPPVGVHSEPPTGAAANVLKPRSQFNPGGAEPVEEKPVPPAAKPTTPTKPSTHPPLQPPAPAHPEPSPLQPTPKPVPAHAPTRPAPLPPAPKPATPAPKPTPPKPHTPVQPAPSQQPPSPLPHKDA